MEATTNVDVTVNITELKALLDSRLPLVFTGASVQASTMIIRHIHDKIDVFEPFCMQNLFSSARFCLMLRVDEESLA